MRLVTEEVGVFDRNKEHTAVVGVVACAFVIIDVEGTATICIQINNRCGAKERAKTYVTGG